MYSAIAAIVGVWVVIIGVIILKNLEDCVDTFCRNRGFQIYTEEDVPDKWMQHQEAHSEGDNLQDIHKEKKKNKKNRKHQKKHKQE